MINNTKNIYYWSPFTSKVATVNSVLNSTESLNTYNNNFNSSIIDAVHEWNEFENDIKKRNINLIKLNKKSIFNSFKKDGFIKSRLAYWYIFLKCFFPLKKLIEKEKPDYLIIHLITSLPLILYYIFSFETKLILRVSGFPKFNFLRKIIWKLASKKIHIITSPTNATLVYLKKYDFLRDKVVLLRDPIINIKSINEKFKYSIKIPDEIKNFINKNDFYLSVGRLTRQKNFLFLVECINILVAQNNRLKFLIIGNGELKKEIKNKIINYNLDNNVKMLDYSTNIHYFLKRCKAFILSSLWEDPGFVLIEAAYQNCIIISSDCPNGPKEIINSNGGYLFKSNSKDDFLKIFKKYLNDSPEKIYEKKKIIKKRVNNFSCYRHYLSLKEILK